MGLEVVATRDDLADFLDFLYEKESGYVYIATKTEDNFGQEFFLWPQQKDDIYGYITSNTPHREVYIAPALFTEKNAHREYVKGTHVFWTEFDGTLPSDQAMGGLPAPSLRVQSSDTAHEHWYWKLDRFVTDVKLIEDINRGITYKLGADTSAWDSTQILRPPRTINHKRGKVPVVLFQASPHITKPDAFSELPTPPKLASTYSSDDLLDTAWIIARYTWPKQYFDFFRAREIPVGERSTAMMRLGYMCAEVGMNDQEIFSILYSADERWKKFRGRPDRERRLNDIVTKVRIKHPVAEAARNAHLQVFGFNTFLQTETKIEWKIPGLLQKTGSMLLTSKPGLGKTQLSMRFAMHLALGKNYLHYEITEPTKVAFFSLEMGHADLKYFASLMATKYTREEIELLEQNLLMIPLGESLYLDRDDGKASVLKVLQDHAPEGLFFDSLGSTTSRSANDEEVIKEITDWDSRIRNDHGVFSWFIHHNRKATAQNKKPKTLDDVYGSTYIAARATSVYTLWAKDESLTNLEVINLKKRLAQMEKPFLVNRTPDLNFEERAVVNTITNDEQEFSFSNFLEPEPETKKSDGPGLEF